MATSRRPTTTDRHVTNQLLNGESRKVRDSLVVRVFLPIPEGPAVDSHPWQVGISFIPPTYQDFSLPYNKKK